MTTLKKYIGYYAHHHGSGHIVKAANIVSHMNAPVKIMSSAKEPDGLSSKDAFVSLPIDTDDASISGTTPSYLHFATTRSDAIRSRMMTLSDSLKDVRLLMVDVSVEVTQIARLLSIPTIVMRMHGDRNDTAHLQAYESAEVLIAPFPKRLEQNDTPKWVTDKTKYVGGFSKFQSRERISQSDAKKMIDIQGRSAVIMTSLGGDGIDLSQIILLAKNAVDWQWIVVGKTGAITDKLPSNVHVVGTVSDTWSYLCAADLVIGSGGQNTIMEIATADKPCIIIPEPRPYEEQVRKAETLEREDYVTVYWTVDALLAENIEQVLNKTVDRKPRLSELLSEDGSEAVAKVLDDYYEKLIW